MPATEPGLESNLEMAFVTMVYLGAFFMAVGMCWGLVKLFILSYMGVEQRISRLHPFLSLDDEDEEKNEEEEEDNNEGGGTNG